MTDRRSALGLVMDGESDIAMTEPLRREQLQARLEVLKREDRVGQEKLRDLEQQLTTLRETLLRISGAILVLEELLGEETPAESANETAESARTATNLTMRNTRIIDED
jgi:hypothetical protein